MHMFPGQKRTGRHHRTRHGRQFVRKRRKEGPHPNAAAQMYCVLICDITTDLPAPTCPRPQSSHQNSLRRGPTRHTTTPKNPSQAAYSRPWPHHQPPQMHVHYCKSEFRALAKDFVEERMLTYRGPVAHMNGSPPDGMRVSASACYILRYLGPVGWSFVPLRVRPLSYTERLTVHGRASAPSSLGRLWPERATLATVPQRAAVPPTLRPPPRLLRTPSRLHQSSPLRIGRTRLRVYISLGYKRVPACVIRLPSDLTASWLISHQLGCNASMAIQQSIAASTFDGSCDTDAWPHQTACVRPRRAALTSYMPPRAHACMHMRPWTDPPQTGSLRRTGRHQATLHQLHGVRGAPPPDGLA